jgi:hypothetical protein
VRWNTNPFGRSKVFFIPNGFLFQVSGQWLITMWNSRKEPPALAGDFQTVRGAEKILEPGEDWRLLGTDADPVVQEAYGTEP